MTKLLSVIFIVVIPALVLGYVILRIRYKRGVAERFTSDLMNRLKAMGAEIGDATFKWQDRTFLFRASPNPIFSEALDLRLSTFCDSVLEFEIREAENLPKKQPETLRVHPLFKRCGLETQALEESLEYIFKLPLTGIFPARWSSFSKMHCELVLSGNRFRDWDDASLRADLELLAKAASIPAWRTARGGTWTYREGWEKYVAAWHWKPEQQARLPEGTKRWLISCWTDNAYLNRPLVRVLQELAGAKTQAWITNESDFRFLEYAFGRPAALKEHLAIVSPDMAVAADQYLDGEFMNGLLAMDESDLAAAQEKFRGSMRFTFHERAIDLMPRLKFYARRLYDDEFSWFSGEYEIVSATLTDGEVRAAMEKVAREFNATVKQIDRPFSFKLLKEDRLELSF